MSYQDEIKYSPETDKQDDFRSRQQKRRERRAELRANRQAGGLGWAIGLILILIGGLYLLNNMGVLPEINNWWALFILLPGIGTFSASIGAYRRNGGQLTMDVILLFIAGLLFFGLTAVFLFELNFGWLWPLFLIAAGLLLLASPLLVRNKKIGVSK